MNKGIIRQVVAILFCLFLIGCSIREETTGGRRPAVVIDSENVDSGSTDGESVVESTNNNNRGDERSCHQEFDNEDLINLVVITGNRANTSEIPIGSALDDILCDFVGRTFEISNLAAQGNIAFVVSDGEPWRAEVIGQNGRPADLSVSANNDYMLNNRIRNSISHVILPFMDSDHLMAQTEEADLFEALHIASRIIRDMDSDRENHILIVDSGITTAGHIDMREFDILENGVSAEIVNRLSAAGLLPNLSDVAVSFFNIGGGAYPQQVPSGPVEDALKAFWRDIIEATGAQILQMQGRSEGGNPRTVEGGFPFVSNVEFETPEVDFSDLRSEVFSADHLGFIANESEFINEMLSRDILAETARTLTPFLQNNPAHLVYIVGSQAVGPDGLAGGYTLSLERAGRVKDLLVTEFNLPAAQLIAVGAGTTPLSWRNTDEFESGQWRDDLAEQNRVVAVIPSTAEEMVELRSNGLID